jgi:hypothetical protein
MAKFPILCGPNQIPTPNKYLEFGYKGLVFCKNNGWLMENMVNGLTEPKRAENTTKAPKFICPKVWDFDEKMLHWVSVVRV